jgi:hypothetical protein
MGRRRRWEGIGKVAGRDAVRREVKQEGTGDV